MTGIGELTLAIPMKEKVITLSHRIVTRVKRELFVLGNIIYSKLKLKRLAVQPWSPLVTCGLLISEGLVLSDVHSAGLCGPITTLRPSSPSPKCPLYRSALSNLAQGLPHAYLDTNVHNIGTSLHPSEQPPKVGAANLGGRTGERWAPRRAGLLKG